MIDFSKNYFELFDIPVSYNIDTDRLSEHYRDLQRVVHPDRFASATDHERRLSMQGASQINEAYQVLRDDVSRARYLLSLHGVAFESVESSTQDMTFLMEQMAMREQLESAASAADPYRSIDELKQQIRERMGVLVDSMTDKMATAGDSDLEEAIEIVRKMQFLQKLRQNAEDAEAQLDESF